MENQNHSELSPVSDPEVQDILDSIELAFFDIPLAECTLEDLPLDPAVIDESYFFNFKMREKQDFDMEANCRVYVAQFTFDHLRDDELSHENILAIEWQREADNILIVDLTDKTEEHLRELAKRTLALITEL
jgi:hypothetical protein